MQNSNLLAGLLIAWGISALATAQEPVDAVAPDATPVDAAFLAPYTAMLESGYSGPSGLDDARRNYASARAVRPDDPRVEYGFALVLLKNFQQEEALTHVRAAIDADPAYIPAAQLRFRESLRGRDFEGLFQQMLNLSDAVGVISPNPPPEERRQEVARWLGVAAGYLEGPVGVLEVNEQAVRVARRLRARLGASLLDEFEAGRLAISRRHQRLLNQQLAAVEVAGIERQEELQETQAAREELDEEREQLEMTREEWDAWIEEQVSEIDVQLESLENHYGKVAEDQDEINRAALQVRTEISQITVLIQQANSGQTLIAMNPFILEAQVIARQVELEQYSAEYNDLERERVHLLAGTEHLFGEREASLARYQKATGNAANRIRQIDRWDRRLEQEADNTTRSDLENARQVRSVRHRIQNWATYDPFELNAEPERLLSSYREQTP